MIPDSYVWVVGPTMDLAEKEFREVWKHAVTKNLIPVRRKSERELFIQFENGTHIECRSEENPDQLIGEGLDLIVLAEAARLKIRTWDQYLRPALADRQGRALFTSTPRGFNYFYDFFQRGQDPTQLDWASWKIPSSRNPILPASEILDAKRNSTPEAFAQEWEAEFIAYAGLVYPEFSSEVHVSDIPYRENLRTSLWVDPGTTAPYACLLVQITPDEHVFVIDEIYRTGRVTEQIIREARDRWPFLLEPGTDMPREEVDVIVDKAASEASASWRLNGWRAWGEKPKIAEGIRVHHKFLRDPIRSRLPQTLGPDDPGLIIPRIQVDRKCKNLIREHGVYHYPDDSRKRIETNKSEIPVDADNHALDALRYGYYNTWPELFNETPSYNSIEGAEPEAMDQILSDMHISGNPLIGGYEIEQFYASDREIRLT